MLHDHVSDPPLCVAIANRVVDMPVNEHRGEYAGKHEGKDNFSDMLPHLMHSNRLSQNDQDPAVAATDWPCEKPATATRLHLIVLPSFPRSIERTSSSLLPLRPLDQTKSRIGDQWEVSHQ
jgi:hypothetical protein